MLETLNEFFCIRYANFRRIDSWVVWVMSELKLDVTTYNPAACFLGDREVVVWAVFCGVPDILPVADRSRSSEVIGPRLERCRADRAP